jgi:hypothetical protein
MVFGLFFRKALILQIQNFAGNFLPSVLLSYWVIRFAIGFSFQATAPALRRKPSTHVTWCCITIHASAESLHHGDEADFSLLIMAGCRLVVWIRLRSISDTARHN